MGIVGSPTPASSNVLRSAHRGLADSLPDGQVAGDLRLYDTAMIIQSDLKGIQGRA